MKETANKLLDMVRGQTFEQGALSVFKAHDDRYHLRILGTQYTNEFSLEELREEKRFELAKLSKRTVLVQAGDEIKTDFYAKNRITMPSDSALLVVELSIFMSFANNASKMASDKIQRDKLLAKDRHDFWFGKRDGMATVAERKGAIQACLKKQCREYDWEKAKAQAAKLCGGAKVASRMNHIDFQASCISQKTGKVKSFKQSNKQFEKASANPRVSFKAKENYNSKGAVRGGNTSLTYSKKVKLESISSLINKAIPSKPQYDLAVEMVKAGKRTEKNRLARQARALKKKGI